MVATEAIDYEDISLSHVSTDLSSNPLGLESYVSGNTDVSSYTNIMFIDNE